MSFETYPLPESNRKIDDLNERIAAQHQMLLPLVTKLFGALDGRVNEQAGVVAKVNGKLARAINGRIKQQQSVVNGAAATLVDALNTRIAEQGRNLDLQSAILSRLGTPNESLFLAPGGLAGAGATISPQSGGVVRPPLSSQVTSQTAGVTVPAFPLSPAEVVPPIYQTSLQSAGGLGWAAMVDCNARTIDVYDLSRDDNPWKDGAGMFVPIRYAENREDLYYNWLGRGQGNEFTLNVQYQPQWIDIACHARDTNGEGWPARGDFPHYENTTLSQGYPVGDWPFDRAGNYIGI